MVFLGIIVVLGLVGCTYTAPESKASLDDLVVALTESNPQYKTKEIDTALGDIQKNIESKDSETKQSIKDVLETVAITGQFDRGFVSDLINSTLGGVQMGFSIGNRNGTINQLCIKLGNIALGGCRRTAPHVKELLPTDHNRTQVPPEDYPRPTTEDSSRKARRESSIMDLIRSLLQVLFRLQTKSEN